MTFIKLIKIYLQYNLVSKDVRIKKKPFAMNLNIFYHSVTSKF